MVNFVLLEHALDQHLLRETLPDIQRKALYPSEASVLDASGRRYGQCLRAVYYRLTDTPPSDPPDARAVWVMELGRAVEALIINLCKEAGIWVADHVRWYDEEYHLSGEVDLVVRPPGAAHCIGVEIKTFYSYQAACEILGTSTSPGFPKMDQLLQAAVYAWKFRNLLAGFKMLYIDRGSAARREFDIQCRQEVQGTATRTVILVDGRPYRGFTIEDILARYRTVYDYYLRREVPPRDYKPYYTLEEMQARLQQNLVDKKTAQGFQSQPRNPKYRKADWRCHYCRYLQLCWPAAEVRQLLGED